MLEKRVGEMRQRLLMLNIGEGFWTNHSRARVRDLVKLVRRTKPEFRITRSRSDMSRIGDYPTITTSGARTSPIFFIKRVS